MDTDRYRVRPNAEIDLKEWATTADGATDLTRKTSGDELDRLNERLGEIQQLFYADGRHKLLVVLQGMDTSGKDGTIKQVFRYINPLGVRVANFKRPNDVESQHDFLWRVHHNCPLNGQVAIFNRSHYEDVLVVRVHGLVPPERVEQRYEHLVNFERVLADEGTVIRKFFLHISKDEQRRRLQERIDNPAKHWKFEHGDVQERRKWDAYQEAYEIALGRTSTKQAPWYVVPGNQKWYRNLVISRVLIDTLEGLDLHYPEPAPGLIETKID